MAKLVAAFVTSVSTGQAVLGIFTAVRLETLLSCHVFAP
jgi:hypothetical protein